MPDWFKSFPRYLLVALVSALSDYICFLLLTNFSIFYVYAHMASRVIGGIVSFLLNKYWSFDSRDSRDLPREGIRFLILYAFSYFLSTTLLYVLTEYFNFLPLLAKMAGDISCMVINFTVMKLWVYAPQAVAITTVQTRTD